MVSIGSNWFINRRRTDLINQPVEKLKYDYEVEMKARFLLQKSDSFWTRNANAVNKPNTADETYRAINDLYKQGLKQFSDSSFIYLAYGNFLFGKGNLNYCLTIFSKAKRSLQLKRDVSFFIFKRSREIEKNFAKQKGTLEVKKYFRFLYLSRKCEQSQTQYIARKLSLFTELRKGNPNLRKSEATAVEMHTLLVQLQSMYREMFNINPAPKVLRRYASFIFNFVGHAEMTKEIVELADKIDSDVKDSDQKQRQVGLENQAALFDERNAVILISGEESRLGEILEVSLGAVDMFGYSVSSEIIGINIASLMPNPFSGNFAMRLIFSHGTLENHHSFLRKYLETGYANVLDMTRNIIARNKQGYIFEVCFLADETCY